MFLSDYEDHKNYDEVYEAIQNFLNGLNPEDLDISSYIDPDDIELNNAHESIRTRLENRGAFRQEVIYYTVAMDYLKENDPSLTESMNLAAEMCFEVQNLNSETLASLLLSQRTREAFEELEGEIESFFEDIQEKLFEEY